jgi:hypothetical protein
VGLGPDDGRGGDGLVGVEVAAPVLERPGVQGDEGEPVPEDVVHLAGQVGPFAVAGPLLAEGLVAFDEQRPFAQRGDEGASRPDHHTDQGEERIGEADGPEDDGHPPDGCSVVE